MTLSLYRLMLLTQQRTEYFAYMIADGREHVCRLQHGKYRPSDWRTAGEGKRWQLPCRPVQSQWSQLHDTSRQPSFPLQISLRSVLICDEKYKRHGILYCIVFKHFHSIKPCRSAFYCNYIESSLPSISFL